MGKFLTFIFVAAIAIGGYLWLTPYLTVQKLVAGLENENVAEVDTYVDFDRVRTSFQTDFVGSLGLETGAQGSTMDMVGTALATRLAGAFINNIVSPDAMVSVLKDADRRERLGLSDDLLTLIKHGKWVNKTQFVLHDAFDKPTMLLERKGVTWEVVGISLN